jgi:hypothetical protein
VRSPKILSHCSSVFLVEIEKDVHLISEGKLKMALMMLRGMGIRKSNKKQHSNCSHTCLGTVHNLADTPLAFGRLVDLR